MGSSEHERSEYSKDLLHFHAGKGTCRIWSAGPFMAKQSWWSQCQRPSGPQTTWMGSISWPEQLYFLIILTWTQCNSSGWHVTKLLKVWRTHHCHFMRCPSARGWVITEPIPEQATTYESNRQKLGPLSNISKLWNGCQGDRADCQNVVKAHFFGKAFWISLVV